MPYEPDFPSFDHFFALRSEKNFFSTEMDNFLGQGLKKNIKNQL